MKPTAFFLALFALPSLLLSQDEAAPIFNDKDLTGWEVPKGNDEAGWWTVEDGVLRCQSGPKKKGSVLFTEKKYADYELTLDFKMSGDPKHTVDSGVMVRDNGDQIQIGISGSLKRDMTCSPYIPGKGYPAGDAKNIKKLLKPADWNTVVIRVVGPKYVVTLNGQKCMEYESTSAKKEGRIGLQLHGSRDMAIDFRKIRVRELAKSE